MRVDTTVDEKQLRENTRNPTKDEDLLKVLKILLAYVEKEVTKTNVW